MPSPGRSSPITAKTFTGESPEPLPALADRFVLGFQPLFPSQSLDRGHQDRDLLKLYARRRIARLFFCGLVDSLPSGSKRERFLARNP